MNTIKCSLITPGGDYVTLTPARTMMAAKRQALSAARELGYGHIVGHEYPASTARKMGYARPCYMAYQAEGGQVDRIAV